MTDYIRIPIRDKEHQELLKLQNSLTGKIDSYLSRPSLSDVIRYLLDRQEKSMDWTDLNWQQAVSIMANDEASDDDRGQAVARIMVDIERDDMGTQEWIENGDWTGNETVASILEELDYIENHGGVGVIEYE